MNLCRYFLCFSVFSFIGWLYESLYYTVQQKRIVNSGFLSTCFCPIYGMGAMLDLILLGRIENTMLLFFTGMIVTCSLEYFVSWLLETLFHKRWWDYTGWPFNLNGRICLVGGIVFGLFTVALVRVIAPATMELIARMSVLSTFIMTAIVAFVIIADTIKSVKCMDTSVIKYVEKQSEIINELRSGELVKKIKDNFKR